MSSLRSKLGLDENRGTAWPVLTEFKDGQYRKAALPQVVLGNLKSATTVALVSLTLSIALALQSGTHPVAGLATAGWGGIIGGMACSSKYNILGPAGALASTLSMDVNKWGEDIVPWLALFSSAVCMLVAAFGLQRYMLLMPKSVFEGFTVGVALSIGCGQIESAFGLAPYKGKWLDKLIHHIASLGEADWESMVLFFPMAIALYILCRKVPRVPWMTVLPCITIVIGFLAFTEPSFCENGEGNVPITRGLNESACTALHGLFTPGDDISYLGDWHLPTLKHKYGVLKPEIVRPLNVTCLGNAVDGVGSFFDFVVQCISVSVIAILETLISGKIAGMRAEEDFDERDETRALGATHLVCGAVGAMPPTGVFVRTALNQNLGATHTLSQFINAVLVLLVTLVAMPAFSYLPMPAIAALLVVASIRMVPVAFLRSLFANDRKGFCLCILTALICVNLNPVMGLAIGAMLALLINAMDTQRAKAVVETVLELAPSATVNAGGEGRTVRRVIIRGQVCFMNHEEVFKLGAALPTGSPAEAASLSAIIDLSAVTVVDFDGNAALHKLGRKLEAMGGGGAQHAAVDVVYGEQLVAFKSLETPAALQAQLGSWLRSTGGQVAPQMTQQLKADGGADDDDSMTGSGYLPLLDANKS